MCDPGYSGSDCSVPEAPNPDFLKEDFEGIPTEAIWKNVCHISCQSQKGFYNLPVGYAHKKRLLLALMCGFLSAGGVVDAQHFRLLSGGKPSRKCGIMSSGNHLFFSEDGLRMLVTTDMDLSNAR